MAREASLINKRRGEHPTILVDGGDFHRPRPTAHQDVKDRYFYTGMKLLGYDAVAIGEYETAAKLQSPFDSLKQYRLPFLSTNILSAAAREPIAAQEIVKTFGGRRTLFGRIGGWRVGIFSVVSPELVYPFGVNTAATYHVVDPKIAAADAVAKLRGEGCSVIVAISHQTWQKSSELARDVPGIDVVIASHSIHGTTYGERYGKTLVVDPGPVGWSFAEIEIKFDGGGPTLDMYERCHGILDTLGDPRLLKLEHEFLKTMEGFPVMHAPIDTSAAEDTTRRHGG
jgi:2',3'-cyclic-nucleotide 2'-phosphodiesterase (5'-nucleotidase family)